jgi:PAS domain S-box-containing protein
MNHPDPIRVLLVDDDEGARTLVEAILEGIPSTRFSLDWVATAEAGLQALRDGEHDVYLVDYLLGDDSGIELVRRARSELIRAPTILLTGKGRWEVDVEAMEAGVSDYLDKTAVDPALMERSIRYAMDRAHTEEALRRSEARQRSMFDHLPIGLFRTGMDGELLDANPALVQMLGNPAREALEFDHARHFFVNPAQRQTFLARLDQFGEVRGFETQVKRTDGRVLHLRIAARAHRDESGEALYVEGAVEDVSGERRLRDLHARAARFDWVFRDSGLAILLLDLQGRIQECNPAFSRAFGYRPDEIAGLELPELVEESETESAAGELRTLASGTSGDDATECHRRLLATDGTVLWAHIRTGLVRTAEGRPDHLMMVLEDVAEAPVAQES